jgi:hypothetical protein
MVTSRQINKIGEAYGAWLDNQTIVRSVYPSARVVRQGFSVFIRTIIREPYWRDLPLAIGKSDSEAWRRAADAVREDRLSDPARIR